MQYLLEGGTYSDLVYNSAALIRGWRLSGAPLIWDPARIRENFVCKYVHINRQTNREAARGETIEPGVQKIFFTNRQKLNARNKSLVPWRAIDENSSFLKFWHTTVKTEPWSGGNQWKTPLYNATTYLT